MISRLATLSFVLASASLMSCGGDDAPATEAAAATVVVTNNVFTPPNVTVKAGQTVEWQFNQGVHDVTSGATDPGDATNPPKCTPDGKFASGEPQGSGTYRFKFTTAGTFPYYCSPHCANKQFGTVTVTP